MITTNYQTYGTKGFNLRLRIYQNGETRYVNVNKLLHGNLCKKHWNQKKQIFIPSAPFSKENNKALIDFKQKYDKKAINWEGDLFSFLLSINSGGNITNDEEKPKVSELFSCVIKELKTRKHEDGTTKGTYEPYEKTERRLQEYCELKKINYSKLFVESMTSEFINSWFDHIKTKKNGKGLLYVSTMLHSILTKAETFGWCSMEKLKAVRWCKKQRISLNKYQTLTPYQCNRVMGMSELELPKNPKSLLYRDFCIFLLFTGQSPCDAIALKYSDIQIIGGVSHFVFKRRKISEKQVVPCSVPINSKMQDIMDRWRALSEDDYIFPIRNKRKLATQTTNNGDIKHFISRLNNWLKKLGEILECNFPLHTYTFRHTAITNYISKGVPIIYVANMMGTSVENCEKIYYNNQGDFTSRNKVLNLVSF